jgi:hypothetical protein
MKITAIHFAIFAIRVGDLSLTLSSAITTVAATIRVTIVTIYINTGMTWISTNEPGTTYARIVEGYTDTSMN